MKRLALSIVLISMLGAAAVPPAMAVDATADQIVMGPPVEQSIAGWREVGRAPARLEDGSHAYLRDLAAVGDRLAAVGNHCPPEEGRCRSAIWYSDDSKTWTPAEVPGSNLKINDLAATADGAVAIGTDRSGTRRRAAMWSTPDGIEWAQVQAPPARAAGRILATGDPLVVQAGQAMWSRRDGAEWKRLRKAPGDFTVPGPGGYLSWRGGGQDLVKPTAVWHSPDGMQWARVRLPKPLRGGHPAFGAIQIASVGDLWVLIPKEKAPGSIFTSKEGRRWKQVPRPVGMHGGYVHWIDRVGDRVQAYGTLFGPRQALWTWNLGKRSGEPDLFSGRTGQGFGAPVPWHGGYVALGHDARCHDEVHTLWRWDDPGSTDDVAEDGATGAPAPLDCWGWGKDMHGMRYSHTSTLLDDGRVLVVGGAGGSGTSDLETTELFDPGVGVFGLTGYLLEGRDIATATRLDDGRVLVAGGSGVGGPIGSAELYDPATGLFTATGSRTMAGAPDDAILLEDGRVLLVDGRRAEIYDPRAGAFTAISPMTAVRDAGRLAHLPGVRVLVVGRGAGKTPQAAADIFDPASMTFEARKLKRLLSGGHSLTTLANGQVLLAGGTGAPGAAHLYDPTTESFTPAGTLGRARTGHSAVLLPDGRILFISGLGERGTDRSLEAYDPVSGQFTEVGRTLRPRIDATATLLQDGRVLISGGRHKRVNVEGTAELYDPGTGKGRFVKPLGS